MREYTDLEIRITKDQVRFKIDNDVYSGTPSLNDDFFDRLEAMRLDGPDHYGEALFDAVFRSDPGVKQGYEAVRTVVRNREGRFRVRLNLDLNCPELHRICWEALHDPEPPPRRLAAWSGTPLSRALDGKVSSPAKASRLRVLGVVASPKDLGQGKWKRLAPIDVDAEHAALKDALDALDDRVDYKPLEGPATYPEIREHLHRGEFHVLHLVCHGAFVDDTRAEGFVVLEKDDGTVQMVNDKDMAALVDLEDMQLVVLAACESAARSNLDAFLGVAPMMIQYGLPAVVAMQDEVEQATARLFTQAFYDSLARWKDTGGLVDVAVNEARERLYFKHRVDRPTTWEWVTPVVFLGGDGKLFEPTEPAVTELDNLPPLPVTALPETSVRSLTEHRRFAPTNPSDIPSDWRLDVHHLLIDKYEFTLTELRTLAWRLQVDRRTDTDDRITIVEELIDGVAAAGLENQINEKIELLVSYRSRETPSDLLRVVR
jgi:hypothetical protein